MGKKILIAEDSSVILNLTKKILVQQHFDITTVKNGKAVLERLENESYDLILMDINMPLLDGMETTKRIRSIENKKVALKIKVKVRQGRIIRKVKRGRKKKKKKEKIVA